MNLGIRPVGCWHIRNYIRNYGSTKSLSPSAGKVKPLIATAAAIGQPTHESHPHLVKPGEVCTGITKFELQTRRSRLMQSIQSCTMNTDKSRSRHTVVVSSANTKYMSGKIPYPFRQNSDFYYLTGCLEPESVLVLHIDPSEEVKSVLFMRPKDKNSELWDGVRTGPTAAPEYFGVDEAYAANELSNYLARYLGLSPNNTVWFDKSHHLELPNVVQAVQSNLEMTMNRIPESPIPFIHKLRVLKSPAELALMRRTCAIGAAAINDSIRVTAPGDTEQFLYATIDYQCRVHNATRLAYPPVVAGGPNATTIHYIQNNQVIADGDMVLVDAGCEYGGYCSDITRTWPINGEFTDAQRILYEVTLQLQTDLIAMLTKASGARTLDDLFDTMCCRLGSLLQEIGLIDKKISGMELARAAYSFCPHHVSHYLGMDVHDTCTYSRSNELIPGMVFTVEPGIYVAMNRRNVPEEFRGLGVRIEDDCAILPDNSVEVLTSDCAKHPDDLLKLKSQTINQRLQ